MTDHPITPPPELVRQWNEEAANAPMSDQRYLATQAARWGRPAPQPADGEAAKLVAWLRKTSRAAFMDGWPNEESINLTRAADLLERLQELENNG